MTISNYFDYETDIARLHLIPLLLRHGALSGPIRVLDVGCGYGGTLFALTEAVPGVRGQGLDVDASMVRQGRERLGEAATLIHANFFEWSGGPFELILMRDVLEHIGQPEQALAKASALLTPRGFLYASFAPFFGPFGGHQHNASGFCSYIPWLQILPTPYVRRILTVRGNSYKTTLELKQDLESVFATRLTLRRFRRAAAAAGLRCRSEAGYLSRPDYRVKFGWPPIRLPSLPGLSEMLATGFEALMQRHQPVGNPGKGDVVS